MKRHFNRKFFDCKIKNCRKKHFAKHLCHKHYVYYNKQRKFGHRHKCKVEDCNIITWKYEYCYKHKYRIDHNLSLDLAIKCIPKGERHMWWKGGIADYPNHFLMKKNRLIILMNNPKCEICGKKATEIHHRDGSKFNHELSNLMATCHKCNSGIRFRPNKSKYRNVFGKSLSELQKEYGNPYYYWKDLLNKNISIKA